MRHLRRIRLVKQAKLQWRLWTRTRRWEMGDINKKEGSQNTALLTRLKLLCFFSRKIRISLSKGSTFNKQRRQMA